MMFQCSPHEKGLPPVIDAVPSPGPDEGFLFYSLVPLTLPLSLLHDALQVLVMDCT